MARNIPGRMISPRRMLIDPIKGDRLSVIDRSTQATFKKIFSALQSL
jgi:hypothetical protein